MYQCAIMYYIKGDLKKVALVLPGRLFHFRILYTDHFGHSSEYGYAKTAELPFYDWNYKWNLL